MAHMFGSNVCPTVSDLSGYVMLSHGLLQNQSSRRCKPAVSESTIYNTEQAGWPHRLILPHREFTSRPNNSPAAGRAAPAALGYQDNHEEMPLTGPVRLSEKGFFWWKLSTHSEFKTLSMSNLMQAEENLQMCWCTNKNQWKGIHCSSWGETGEKAWSAQDNTQGDKRQDLMQLPVHMV